MRYRLMTCAARNEWLSAATGWTCYFETVPKDVLCARPSVSMEWNGVSRRNPCVQHPDMFVFKEENGISVYNQAGDLAFRTDGPDCAAGRDAEGVE